MKSKTQNFNQWLTESSEEDELYSLGLADLDFEDRRQKMLDEWESDPAVQQAIQTLKDRTLAIRDKWINLDDPEDADEYEKYIEQFGEESYYDLGWLEYTLGTDY